MRQPGHGWRVLKYMAANLEQVDPELAREYDLIDGQQLITGKPVSPALPSIIARWSDQESTLP